MNGSRPFDEKIHARLQALGLSGLSAVLLEGLAPLAPLGAQLAYILEPMADGNFAGGLTDLARWLEKPDQVRAMASRLRREKA